MSGPGYPPTKDESPHWLERQIGQLHQLFARYMQARAQPGNEARDDRAKSAARSEFTAMLDSTLHAIAAHDGITACVATFEGLVLAQAGALPDFEALAAVSEDSFRNAMRGGDTIALGPVEQMVIIGAEHKLALFRIGGLVLGILSPRRTPLATTLSR